MSKYFLQHPLFNLSFALYLSTVMYHDFDAFSSLVACYYFVHCFFISNQHGFFLYYFLLFSSLYYFFISRSFLLLLLSICYLLLFLLRPSFTFLFFLVISCNPPFLFNALFLSSSSLLLFESDGRSRG